MAEETEDTGTEDVSALRKAAEDGRSARAEADLARKELAFVKAGVDTSTKPAQALLNSYAGDLSAEAIQAEAREWSLLKSDEAPAAPDYTEEAKAQEMRDGLDGSPAPDTQPEKSGVDKAFEQFKIDRESGGYSQTDATNRAIGGIINAARQGDPQAIFNRERWEAEAAQHGHGAKWAK